MTHVLGFIEAKEHVGHRKRGNRIFRIDDISSDTVIGLGRKRFKNSLRCNRKHYIRKGSRKLWTSGQNASKMEIILYKNKICVTTV
jgi:hypothetical protein